MDKINNQCEKIKKEKRTGLMTHVVVGYPSVATSRALVKMMSSEGADFIELQIPFSDPLGDGEIIHQANTQALTRGTRPKDAFTLVKILRSVDRVDTPFLFMTYMNIAFTYGLEKFCRDAKRAGVDGLIIPDYNFEIDSREHLQAFAGKHGLVLIRFIALDSDPKRMKFIARGAGGFVYCFSTQGITGVRDKLSGALRKHLKRVRKYFSQPLAVGFGISKATHIYELKEGADIVVVGSAILRAFNLGGFREARIKTRELVKACRR